MARFVFVPRQHGPENLIVDAELHFGHEDGDDLAGLRLIGFAIWDSPEGELYVTFPSRAFGEGPERKYQSLLKAITSDAAPVRDLKRAILTAYHAYVDAPPDPEAHSRRRTS
jgi:hypothetical protein